MTNEDNNRTEGGGFPLTEFQLGLERSVANLNGRVKHCGRNAFAHLRAAWAIRTVDPEMAAFRAITAEEEAASALLLALKERRYPGAERLNHRDHVQKSALTPFINGIRKAMEVVDFASPMVRLHDSKPPSVSVHLDMNKMGLKTSEPLLVSPDQPLNFSIAKGEDHRSVHRFEEELQEIAKDRGVGEIIDVVREEANLRNRLLYAGDAGIPHVEFREGFLLERLRRVNVLLLLTIAIQQIPMHQLFVTQCLQSFLLALRKIEATAFDFDLPPRAKGLAVEIIKGLDGEARASVSWRATMPLTGTFRYGMKNDLTPSKLNDK